MTSDRRTARAECVFSPLLAEAGFRHAFFTRLGGASSGPYASLNFSIGVGDEPEHVAENLTRAGSVLGLAKEQIYFLSQVHGRSAHAADGSESAADFLKREGDVLVSRSAALACAVRSADCVPLLLADRETGAVAAVHAGWRGVVCGAVAAGVRELESLGARAEQLIAAVGPHISRRAFEVSADVAQTLVNVSPDPDVVDRSRPRPHVDLRRIVHAQLEGLGLARSSIDDVEGCTFLDESRFFSFRRDGKRSGRHLSAIVARSR